MFPAVRYCADYDADLIAKEIKGSGYKTISLVGSSMMYHGFASRLLHQLGGMQYAEFTETLDVIKAVKSAEDIGWIRKAAAMQDEIFAKVLAHVKPGMHDYEVMAYSDYVGQVLDGETGYFLGSSSPPGKPALFRMKPHHGRRMDAGDVLVWQAENSGPGGFFAHMCRYIVLGKAPQELTDMIGQTIEMQKYTLGLLKPGAKCSDIFADYNAAMKKRGYQEEKRLHCHGQGYENVERPLIRSDETMSIAVNMNIGIHPIIANERVAATISDNFLTTAAGQPERLHQTPQKVFEL
jgi:Xaa-Pro aminopeptidase